MAPPLSMRSEMLLHPGYALRPRYPFIPAFPIALINRFAFAE